MPKARRSARATPQSPASATRPRPQRQRLVTVKVPAAIEPLFLKAQDYVTRYFHNKVEAPEQGTISISGERYVLLRAASLSVEFVDLVTSLYQDKGNDEARRVASNLLFDMAHAIGRADAKAFHGLMGVTAPIEKLTAGPIHFSFTGWAFIDISGESRPTPDDEFFLLYDHPYSFESDTWLRHRRKSAFPVCMMNAGYSSGWCEESFGLPLVAVEIECLAAGGRHCRFIMAPPSRIEGHLARYSKSKAASGRRARGARVSIPEFFQRKRMEDELRRSHEGLEAKVQERTAELLLSNQRLRTEVAERKRAEEVRDEFLSVAAHELKTPLTSLRGFSQLLLAQLEAGRQPDPGHLRMALAAIDRQSQKLAHLVSQLLDISRLQAGSLVLERRPTDIAALLASVVDSLRSTTARHQITLRCPAGLQAHVDALRLEQVLTNLLDNAIKYSPDGGPIAVVAGSRSGRLKVTVSDRGIGVPQKHRARIFDRYYRAHDGRGFAGMGLGLYISRQIVELHGGTLVAEHPRVGGTALVLCVPAGPPAP